MKVDRSDLCPLYLGAERTLGAQVTFETTRDGRAARLVLKAIAYQVPDDVYQSYRAARAHGM
jgi:hypothetical protein